MANSITEILRLRIIRLHYKPGDPLNEKNLAKELEVSRTPIREALIRLSQENLVTLSPYSMARVSDINLRNFQELIHCRLILERGIARLCVLNVTENETRELERLQKKISAISEEDSAAFVRHDEELHRIIRKAAANVFLDGYLLNVQNHFTRIQYLIGHRPKKEGMNEEITRILDALRTRDHEKMENLLVGHVGRFVEVVRRHFSI